MPKSRVIVQRLPNIFFEMQKWNFISLAQYRIAIMLAGMKPILPAKRRHFMPPLLRLVCGFLLQSA
ncbi:hypothetical protein [Sporomusa ovata]|nr:hypothetical protein [Sporomusa ovata]